jgi:hypothetical protein
MRVSNQPSNETWFNKPRSFLWKLCASLIWVVIWFSILIGSALLFNPGPQASETQKQGSTQIVLGVSGITQIVVAAGIIFLFKRPKRKK